MNHPARGGRRTIPTELAAMAVGVPEATIRKWASRGKLTRYGSARKAEYDIEELTALMAGKSPPAEVARLGGSPSGAADRVGSGRFGSPLVHCPDGLGLGQTPVEP